MNRISYQNSPRLAHNWQERSVHNLQESPVTSGKRVSRKAPPANVNPNTSMRTVILGIDKSGRLFAGISGECRQMAKMGAKHDGEPRHHH